MELKPCPMCGSPVHIEDRTTNKIGHKGVEYCRIVCDRNSDNTFNPEQRCWIKTVCGPSKFVIRQWQGRRPGDKPSQAMKTRTKRFLFWRTVEWLSHDDGGVDCYSFGRLTGCRPIHEWILGRRK